MDETIVTTPTASPHGQGETVAAMAAISPNGQDATIITIPSAAAPVPGTQQTVCNAAAFGWGIAELLGRCYLLAEADSAQLDWSGTRLVLLQQVYTPREKIRALMAYICSLSNDLGLSSCKIDDERDEHYSSFFVEVLKELVKQFCEYQPSSLQDTMFAQLRGQINRYFFYWDLQIHDALQDRPTVVAKAYLVGRTLAAMRWYIGLEDQALDGPSVIKMYQEYIPILAPYISPYATVALSNSVELWWKAISSGQVQPGSDGMAPIELRNQADIWFSLLTNERTSLSYVPPALMKKSSHYTGQIVRLYWPFFAGGLAVLLIILALILVVILSRSDLIAKAIAAAGGFIAASGVTHLLGSNLGGFLQKATMDVEATRGSVIGNIRDSNERQAVVKSTYIAPGSVGANKGA